MLMLLERVKQYAMFNGGTFPEPTEVLNASAQLVQEHCPLRSFLAFCSTHRILASTGLHANRVKVEEFLEHLNAWGLDEEGEEWGFKEVQWLRGRLRAVSLPNVEMTHSNGKRIITGMRWEPDHAERLRSLLKGAPAGALEDSLEAM